MRKIALSLVAFAGLLFTGCAANPDEVCYLPSPTFTVNGQPLTNDPIEVEVVDNGILEFGVENLDGYDFFWTGPNNFQSSATHPVIPAPTSANSGTYTLTISKGICTGDVSANVNVTVISPQCTPINNRITFDSGLLNSVNFNSVSAFTSADQFRISAYAWPCDLTIGFASAVEPATGVYSINTECPTSFLEGNQVCVSMVYSGQYCVAQGGQVFVTRLDNGKYTATFCSVEFNGFQVPVIASTKITEP